MPKHPVVGPEWIPSAPILVEESIEIAASPDTVWPHVADHESWPEWFTALKSVERIGAGAGVGSGRRVKVPGGTIDEEFTAWDENELFAFAVVKSPLPMLSTMAESVTLEPAGDAATKVTYRQGLEGKRYLGGLMRLVWKRAPGQTRDALANLKARIEST